MHLEDIHTTYIPAVAKLLQFRPNEDREALARRIDQDAKELPLSLRRPSLLGKVLFSCRHHCELHKSLDPEAVRTVLHHIQLEVGIRLNKVVAHFDLLAPEHCARIMRLRELHALWLDGREYRRTFKESSKDLKWRFRTDKCGACIISQITTDLQILLDLRWALRSRATRAFVSKRGNPRLQPWVQVWIATIAGYVEEASGTPIDLDAVMLANEKEAIQLKKTRIMIGATKHKQKYRKDGTTDGGFVTEIPCNYSWPIVDSPHKPKPQATPADQDLGDIQAEDLVEDINECQLEDMDPFEALTSTPYLPGTADSRNAKMSSDSRMTIETVCADQATKGLSPYQHKSYRKPELESIYGDDQDEETASEAEALKVYIAPRAMWKSAQPQETALQSSALLPFMESDRRSVLSQETWERSSISSKASWVTEKCLPTATATSLYSSSVAKARCPSQSWLNLSKVAEQTPNHRPNRRSTSRKQPPGETSRTINPAETYQNLLSHSSPFTTSATTTHALNQGPKQEASKPEKVRPQSSSAPSASTLFLNLYNEVSRPTNRHSSSATSSKRAEHGAHTSHRSAESTVQCSSQNWRAPYVEDSPRTTPVTARAIGSHRYPSSSTQEFLSIYDEVVSSYLPDRQPVEPAANLPPTESTTTICTASRRRLTSEALALRRKPKSEHEKDVDRICKDITRGTALGDHEPNLRRADSTATARVKRRAQAPSVGSIPSLTSRTTLSSHSNATTAILRPQNKPSAMRGRPGERTNRPERDNADNRSVASEQTTWSDDYHSQLAGREDLGWYNGHQQEKKR